MTTIEPSIKLLDLTPVCLQKADTILDTMCFMCLDQGHDFHDGSGRTRTLADQETWIDSTISDKNISSGRKGYLNKINDDIFTTTYKPQPNENKILTTEQIFGKTEFIKGLVNTTFSGGNGNYGILMIDDVSYKKLIATEQDEDNVVIDSVERKLAENIKFHIFRQDINYYIYSREDTTSAKGLTLNNLNEIADTSALFLPFYQRVYNDGMHELWTFNIKKHIFIVKLISLNIVESETGEFELNNPVFKCEKYTTINLTIPEYRIDFKNFFSPTIVKGKNNIFLNKIKELGFTFPKKSSNTKYEEEFAIFFAKHKVEITELFLENLLLGYVKYETDGVEQSDNVFYQDGKFLIKTSSEIKELTKFIPRGAKYYFENCRDSDFIKFLSLLFGNQMPFIHSKYNADLNSENAKTIIADMMFTPTVLDNYVTTRDDKIVIDDTHFISKQYGFVTDTSIGANSNKSTADFLIDSFNNLEPNTNCPETQETISQLTASAEPKLATIPAKSISPVTTAESISPVTTVESITPVTNVESITPVTNVESITPVTSVESISPVTPSETSTKPTITIIDATKKRRQAFAKQSADISKEEISKVSTLYSPSEPQTKLEISDNEAFFDNIENLDTIFDLSLTKEMLSEPFAKININSTKPKIEFNKIINEYSNDIQLYYEYLPQNAYEGDIQYFNNCWKSNDFYQQQQQKGGSNYPYKFAIVSGSIDSSKLGGQSIPQYHPPEIDLYMPIFELSGNGNLRGIIVRMTFVKEVLVNAINSKSQVVVFCHFIYIDLINSGITVQQEEGIDNRSDYPNVFNKLLNFAVEKTEYIGKEDKCIDIQRDLQDKTNLNDIETDIEFIIKFPNGGRKNWYKFFTYTYGPSVQTSIVIPVNNNSIEGLKLQCRSDYVAAGIVNVAENLWADGESLRMVFNNEQEKLLFVKLFLIRNKYTGDKSRSTDTLFLNQTKYLEGVQISNDENTLYNAQMFGLNTVWSTLTKTVFYLAPYLTKNSRVPITTGAYVNQLCNGLKNNPSFRISISAQEDETAGSIGEDADKKRIMDDFIEEVLAKIEPDVLNKIENNKTNPKIMNTKENLSFLSLWAESVYNINSIRNILQEVKERNIVSELNKLWENYKSIPQPDESDFQDFLKHIEDKVYEYFSKINVIYDNLNTIYDSLVDKSKKLYQKLIILLQICKDNGDLLKLKNMIVLLNKTIPLWILSVNNDIKTTMTYYYCDTVYTALTILNSYIENDTPIIKNSKEVDTQVVELICQKYLAYKIILNIIGQPPYDKGTLGKATYWKNNECSIIDNNSETVYKTTKSSKSCSKTEIPKFTQIKKIVISPPNPIPEPKYLEDLDTSKVDIDSIKNNENKFTLVSLELLNDFNKGLVTTENISTKYDNLYVENLKNPDRVVNDDNIFQIESELGRTSRPIAVKRIIERVTEGKRGGFKEDESQLHQSPLKDNTSKIGGVIISPTLNKEMLQKFYENSYKCNVGNYLKGFIETIQHINKKYSNLSFENITSCQELIIKIAMLNIENINKSFVPKITSSEILNKIIAIDNSYSVDEMISILNTYKNQLDMYKLINIVESNEYTRVELINLLNENISDITLNDLKLPYSKYALKARLLELPIVTSEIMMPPSQTNLSTNTFLKPATSLSESVKSIQQNKARAPMIDYTKLGKEPWKLGREQLESESSYSDGVYSTFGGISFKNKKRNRNSKTKKNKIKSKKDTIKKRNKRNNKTRKH